jgi:uncharacterized YkwD family protein
VNRFKKLILTGTLVFGSIGMAGAVSAAPYTVSSNDAMCQQYGGFSLTSLIQANPQIANLDNILAGMGLNIPSFNVQAPVKAPEQAPVKAPVKAPEQAPVKAPEQAPVKAPVKAPEQAPVKAPEQAPSTGSTSQSTYASQVVNLVNQERAKAGLQSLASDSSLSAMALVKAKDMYNNHYFDHTSPTYGSPFDMMKTYGISYSYAGENIAMGQRTPAEVMTGWMNSAGHRQNILSANYTKIGVAYYNGEWVQEFIAN